MTPGCEVCSLHVLLGGGHRRAGVVGGPQADHPHHAHPQVGLLLWLAGSGQSHRRPLGRERPRGLQGSSLYLEIKNVDGCFVSDPGADLETLLVCGQKSPAGEGPSDHIANQSFVEIKKIFLKTVKIQKIE